MYIHRRTNKNNLCSLEKENLNYESIFKKSKIVIEDEISFSI